MALTSLVVCAHDPTTEVLRHILEQLGWTVKHCMTAAQALERLAQSRFETVVVDCENAPSAMGVLQKAPPVGDKASLLSVALVGNGNDVRSLFAEGVNFVLYKPVSEDRASSSFRAARSMMKSERRRNKRVLVQANASLDYANVENVPATLLDLSDEGTALQSDRKLPPDCRVYFEFALPGHTSLIRLSGEVIWRDSAGRVGMRFVTVPTSSRRVLSNWLKNNAPSQSSAPKVPITGAPIPKISGPGTKQQPDHPERGLARLRTNPGNRREQSRHACRLGADV